MICVISRKLFGPLNMHDIQTNNTWTFNPYGDAYAIVPENMIEAVLATKGFLDPIFSEDGTELISFTALEKPEIPDEQVVDEPTQLDQIEAQVAYTAMMTDTLLEV